MHDSDRHEEPASGTPGREANERMWAQWPCCAACGRRRLTVCPVCGTAGDQLPLAEYLAPAAPVRRSRDAATGPSEPPGGDVEILLVCPQCDEAFAPRFYRRCPPCGHDAQTGLDLPVEHVEPLSNAVLLIICGMIAVVAAIALYFRWLFPP